MFGTLRFSLLSAVCFFVHGCHDIIVVIEHTVDMVKIEWIVVEKERCPDDREKVPKGAYGMIDR